MKKLILSLVLFVGLVSSIGAFTTNGTSLKHVEGVNYISRFTSTQTVNMSVNGQQYSFSFYSDGTYSGTYPGGNVSGNYVINGANSISLGSTTCSCLIGLVNGDYKLNSFHYNGYQYSRKSNVRYY